MKKVITTIALILVATITTWSQTDSTTLKGDWYVYKQVDQNDQIVEVNITLHFTDTTVNFKENNTDAIVSYSATDTSITMGNDVYTIVSLSTKEMILKDASNNTLYIEKTETEGY